MLNNLYKIIKDLGFGDSYIDINNNIVIPNNKTVFRYCCFANMCEHVSGKHRNYLVNMMRDYELNGYSFYVIFEDEYKFRYDVLISRIKNILNINDAEEIYARKCIVSEIDTTTSSNFINKFHIQGNTGSSVKLGLFYINKNNSMLGKPKLVSVMTFGKLSRAKGNKYKHDLEWELIRYCSDIKYRPIGAAGKLLKYFERNYEWKNIISFADRRWSNKATLYTNIGFVLVKKTEPNYYYLKLPDYTHRIHRFAFRRSVLREMALEENILSKTDVFNKTEFELAIHLGYDRIWDCGNFKFVKYNEEKYCNESKNKEVT